MIHDPGQNTGSETLATSEPLLVLDQRAYYSPEKIKNLYQGLNAKFTSECAEEVLEVNTINGSITDASI